MNKTEENSLAVYYYQALKIHGPELTTGDSGILPKIIGRNHLCQMVYLIIIKIYLY